MRALARCCTVWLGAGIILAAAGSSAQSFDRTREPAETIASLLPLAEAGDAEAQFQLGRLYQRDSSRNGSEWYRWTLAAAERGHVIALVHIGLFHAQDLLDPAEGADWYLRAAQLGGVGGQLFLGEAYRRGWGVPLDPARAATWLRKAAEQGSISAQYELAGLLAVDRGVRKDLVEAATWYRRAAVRGSARSQYELGRMYSEGWGVRWDDHEAAKWFARACRDTQTTGYDALGRAVPSNDPAAVRWSHSGGGGYAPAQVELAKMFKEGRGVPQNDRAAVRLLQLAAEGGNAEAQYLLGRRSLEGRGLAKDELQAFKWLNRAAGATHSPAQLLLASLYPDTIGEPLLDSATVAKLRRRAASGGGVDIFALRLKAEDGDPEAQARLGFSFRRGFGVPRDLEQAHFWLLRAVEQDDISAQIYLAELYLFDSPSGKPEERKAAALYRRAAEQGHEWAQLKLGKLCFKGRGVSRDLLEAYVWVSLGTSRRMSLSDVLLLQVIAGELTAEQLDEAGRRIEARRSE